MSENSIFKKKSFYIILILVLAVVGYFTYVRIMDSRYEAQQEEPGDIVVEAAEDIGRENTYTLYLEDYQDVKSPEHEMVIDLFDYSDAEDVEELANFQGEENVLVTNEGGYVEYQINVPETGMYNVFIRYYPLEGRGIDIERGLVINGELPFLGAENLTFSRVWTDGGEVTMDNRGNEIRPPQIENPRWEQTYFKDYMGYYVEPYKFYLEQGENVIRLESVSEHAAYSDLIIRQQEEVLSYADFIKSIDFDKFNNENLEYEYIKQGEDAEFRSSPTLYAFFDRASSNTVPYSAAKIKLNAIGGDPWRVPGQWIEWELEVPEDGFYNISFKARQNYNRGMVSVRTVMIDDNIPFAELGGVEFMYDTSWDMMVLGDENGTPYKIPLTEGKHSIRLEVTLGDLGEILNQIEDSVYRLNRMYRRILVLTGARPDPYRDYNIDREYPDVMMAMEEEIDTLNDIVDQLVEYTGQKGSESAVAGNLAIQLERFIENPDIIPRSMENFKQNISSLGTSVLNLSNSQLDIDYIYICNDGAEIPDVSETFFGKVAHEIRSFAASFVEDYDTLGNVYEEGRTIEVWLLSGRDQSTILKNMIDEEFTPEYDIGVNVKLIDMNTLLPAVVAGTGPDVALTVNNDVPVEYALRNSTVDLTQFDDFEDILPQYNEEAFVPYMFQGGIYGIPETQNFNVMFYRSDILQNELGLNVPEDIPQTWDDVIALLPALQENNMQFALPSTEREIDGIKNPDTSAMLAFLFQNQAKVYNEEQTRTLLDEEQSVEAFENYTRMYTHYGIPQKFDFVNRFRTGEMPIGIADYSNFNTLSVFAPEIRGLWDFALMPGTVQEDGSIDRSVTFWGQASIMLTDAEDYDACWKFLKWWADADVKVRFARELESIMGAAARYATANIETFEELPWSNQQAAIIREQWQWTEGVPTVAGGYSTNRHMINAFRKVTYENEDPRETMLDYTRTINEDIRYKRRELGLDEK